MHNAFARHSANNEWMNVPEVRGQQQLSIILNLFIYLLNNKNWGIDLLSHIKRTIEIDVHANDGMKIDDGLPMTIVNFILFIF